MTGAFLTRFIESISLICYDDDFFNLLWFTCRVNCHFPWKSIWEKCEKSEKFESFKMLMAYLTPMWSHFGKTQINGNFDEQLRLMFDFSLETKSNLFSA